MESPALQLLREKAKRHSSRAMSKIASLNENIAASDGSETRDIKKRKECQ